MKLFRTALALGLGLMLALAAQAEAPKPIKKADKEPANDKEFLIRALSCAMSEVKFAEMALKRADSAEVKELADFQVQEHKLIRDELLERARKMKVAVVAGLEKDKQQEYNRLNKLSGADFDREYLRYVGEGYEKGNTLFKKWSKDAEDESLRTAADHVFTRLKKLQEKTKTVSGRLKS